MSPTPAHQILTLLSDRLETDTSDTEISIQNLVSISPIFSFICIRKARQILQWDNFRSLLGDGRCTFTSPLMKEVSIKSPLPWRSAQSTDQADKKQHSHL